MKRNKYSVLVNTKTKEFGILKATNIFTSEIPQLYPAGMPLSAMLNLLTYPKETIEYIENNYELKTVELVQNE